MQSVEKKPKHGWGNAINIKAFIYHEFNELRERFTLLSFPSTNQVDETDQLVKDYWQSVCVFT